MLKIYFFYPFLALNGEESNKKEAKMKKILINSESSLPPCFN